MEDSLTEESSQAIKMKNNPSYIISSINPQESLTLLITPAYNTVFKGNQQPLLGDKPGCFINSRSVVSLAIDSTEKGNNKLLILFTDF